MNNQWKDDNLRTIVKGLWPLKVKDLEAAIGLNKQAVVSLLDGKAKKEPLLHLEKLHRALTPHCKKLGVTLHLYDLRDAWRQTVAERVCVE